MDDKTWLGNLAEIKVAAVLVQHKYEVFMGYGGKTSCDLIAIKDGESIRVQVKGCGTRDTSKSWLVQLRSMRPNRSGTTIKKFDASICDWLGVYIQPEDRVVFYCAATLDGRTAVSVKPLEGTAEWSATGFEIRGS